MTVNSTLAHTRGDTFARTLTLSQRVSDFDKLWMTIRADWATDQADDTDAVSQASLGDGITSTGTYTVSVVFPASETVSWTSRAYVYDVQGKNSAGQIYTLVSGRLQVLPDVTRSTT